MRRSRTLNGFCETHRQSLGRAMVHTAPDIPMIFQGQEFLQCGYYREAVPLDWSKLRAFVGTHQLYRDPICLRRNWFNHTRGLRGQNIHVPHVNDPVKVIDFRGWESGSPGGRCGGGRQFHQSRPAPAIPSVSPGPGGGKCFSTATGQAIAETSVITPVTTPW